MLETVWRYGARFETISVLFSDVWADGQTNNVIALRNCELLQSRREHIYDNDKVTPIQWSLVHGAVGPVETFIFLYIDGLSCQTWWLCVNQAYGEYKKLAIWSKPRPFVSVRSNSFLLMVFAPCLIALSLTVWVYLQGTKLGHVRSLMSGGGQNLVTCAIDAENKISKSA